MSTETDTRPERIDTDEGRAWILAEADSKEELVEELERLIDGYRLYTIGFDGEPDSLVGVYDTIEEASEKMRSISYDMDPSLFFYIMRGDEVVMGDPETRGQGDGQVGLSAFEEDDG